MKLKQELADVLATLKAEPRHIEKLIEYFTAQAADAASLVTSIEANIASLETQLVEAKELEARTMAGIAIFVDLEQS